MTIKSTESITVPKEVWDFIVSQNGLKPLALTVENAAVFCGVGRTTLYSLMRSGALTPKKSGKRTLLLVSELEHLIRNLPTSEGPTGQHHSKPLPTVRGFEP